MNKAYAKIIVEILTNEQLRQMLVNARKEITDWTKPSVVNLSATIGTTWNILTSTILTPNSYDYIPNQVRFNLVREFGEYLPEELKVKTHKDSRSEIPLVHQEPNFTDIDNQETI
jgi:hypothetical protein